MNMGIDKRECDFYNSIVIENVRITPKSLIFYNPFEGQEFKAKIVLQNIGKDAVSVRILNSSSSNVELQPILNMQFLSSGLKIIREIKYKVVMATLVKTCSIPIYINESKYLIEITVKQSKATLRIEPQYLNFGQIDTGPSPARRRITFYNDGAQPQHFHIDLGPNELNIMIEPMRGVILAKSSMEVRVDLIILKEGTYSSEFWIISGVPVCMQLMVTASHGHIETQSRFNMKSFQFIHFPTTYYGLSSQKILLLKNASQKQSIFCITGLKQMSIFNLDDAPSIDSNYYQFRVDPKEGRLFENDVRMFTFTFSPQKKYLKRDDYFLVMMRINKVACRDLNPEDYDGEIFESLPRTPSLLSRGTSEMGSNTFDDYFDIEEPVEETTFTSATNEQDLYVNVMLYGRAESPNVLVTPNALQLYNLDVKLPVKRVLHLENCSKHQSIVLRYNKIAFVVVEPPLITINARHSVEVLVTITPQSYHIIKSAVHFDMLHYDQPRKNKLLQKIGEVKVPLTIHERIVTIVAKGTLQRPWKSAIISKTTYADVKRVCNVRSRIEFTAKQIELPQKDFSHKLSRNYEIKPSAVSLLHEKKMSCILPVDNSISIVNSAELECGDFIPLTPQQLLDISIEPRNQYIDHIVPKSLLKIGIAVQNKNGVDLRLFLKPQKQQYYRMPDCARFIVCKHDSLELTYYIYAHLIGLQNYRLDIIVNECHVFETTVTVNIVQAMLNISPTELNFSTSDRTYKFIEFYNNLNEDIPFQWISTDDFTLEPMEGTVQSRNKLACLVGLDQRKVQGHPYGTYELLIKIGSKHVTFCIKVEKANIEFLLPNHINFGMIPLGLTSSKYISLQNYCKQTVAFRFAPFSWVPDGIVVEPIEGVLRPNVVEWVKVTANLLVEVAFNCQLHIKLGEVKKHNIVIEGIGIFPKILIDEQLQFRKIAASAFDVKKFLLRNTSPVPALVIFDVERLSELYMNEDERAKYFMKNNVQYIKPHTDTCFSIHYYPSYPEIKYSHLPMSVNGIHNHTTKKGKELDGLIQLVPRLRVYTKTFPHKILISQWTYFFHCYDNDNYGTVDEHEICMANTPYATLRLCLRLDNVQPPFRMFDLQGGNIIKQHEFSLVVEMNSQTDPFSFRMKFQPIEYNIYEMRIPVFVKDDYNQDVHNYLYFRGTYYQPTFIFPDESINFGYIPLDIRIVKFVKFKLRYHRSNCFVTVDCDNANVTLTCDMGATDRYRIVKILYYCTSVNLMECFLNVQCTCGSFYQVQMWGGAENNYLTVYHCVEFLRWKYDLDVYRIPSSLTDTETIRSTSVSQMNLKIEEDVEYIYKSEFPFFPIGDTLFASNFHRIVAVVETWVCQQGFFGTKHYTIPNGISQYEICEISHKKQIVLPFCVFFCNVCSIESEFFDMSYDLETNAYVTIYKFYTEVLNILQTRGGILNHIKAESLFSYDLYVTYVKKLHTSKKIYTPERFHLWSKLSWLHLILQTYKVFVLKRLIKIGKAEQREYNLIRTVRSVHSAHSFLAAPISTTDTCHTELNFILDWVNIDYQMTKVKFTNDRFINHGELPDRNITFFNNDFADSTILAAITLTYCPYLEEHFYTLYLPPTSPQQYFYNAYLLIKVWNMLNISLHVKPNDIVQCNPVLLIFLLTYLYDFLTHFKPRKEIHFTAELTKTHGVEVLVVNENKRPINYELCIFNDPRQLFKVNSNRISIPKGRTFKMMVYYTARFLNGKRAVLVLKGEIAGGKFTHGQSFLLIGNTLLGSPYVEIHLNSDIYAMCYKNLEFTPPYHEDCEYELFITYQEPLKIKTLAIVPVKDLLESKTLGRIQIDTPYLVSKNNHIRKCLRLCAITLNMLRLWIFARHPRVGDFYFRLDCAVQTHHDMITMTLEISEDVFRSQCICKGGEADFEPKCPHTYVLKIPCKNESLWKGLLKYFFKFRNEDEYKFWNHYKDSPVGLHVLKRLLFDHQKYVTDDMSYVFEHTFHFEVRNYSKSVMFMERKLEIENTLSVDQYIDVLIHLNERTSNFSFDLHNRKEERYYNVYIN